MISVNGVQIKATVFPDKTSQVWCLPDDLLASITNKTCTVRWIFEDEKELIHLAQLKDLLNRYSPVVNLDMPYLPYARQDKAVDNKATFALRSFATILNALNFNKVSVVDAHSKWAHLINRLEDRPVHEIIGRVYWDVQASCILFPDKGARERYSELHCAHSQDAYVYADKVRDQLTGNIKEITIHGDVKGKTVLIVDDLCDGGMTFKLVAEAALKAKALQVHLYVSHGIFSKGLQTLRDSGIRRIFTVNGEVDIQVGEVHVLEK